MLVISFIDFEVTLEIRTNNWKLYAEKVYALIDLTLDDRILLVGNQSPVRKRINKDTQYTNGPVFVTQTLKFQAKEDKFGIKDEDLEEPKPIFIKTSTNFELDPCRSEKLKCPMLNPIVTKKPVIKELRVDLKNGCRIKNQCNCNLKFKLKQNPKKEIIVGKDHKVDLSFQVINDGDEPAYGSKISFKSKTEFKLIEGPSGPCTTEQVNNGYFKSECSLRKIRGNSGKRDPIISFGFPKDFNGQTSFNIEPVLEDNCNGRANKMFLPNNKKLEFNLKFQSNITIIAEAKKPQMM